MKKILMTVVGAWLAYAEPLQALDIDVQGQAGYQVATIEHENAGGFEAGAAVTTMISRLAAAGVYAGLGAKYSLLDYKTKELSVHIGIPAVEMLGGIDLAFGQRRVMRIGLGYDFALGGKVDWSGNGTSDSKEVASAPRLNHQWSFLLPVGHSSEVGFGLAWFTTSIKASGSDGQIDGQGYVLSGMYAAAL